MWAIVHAAEVIGLTLVAWSPLSISTAAKRWLLPGGRDTQALSPLRGRSMTAARAAVTTRPSVAVAATAAKPRS